MPKKKDKAQEALTALMQKDYFAYCFGVLNDGINLAQEQPRYIPTRFHKWLCTTVWEWLNEKTGNPYDILLLSVPPQHGKSITITETLPSFYLGHFPEKRVIEVSYGSEFAKRFGKANKNKIQRFGGLFGISIANDAKSNVDWKLTNGIGGMISKGIMSPITGQSGDLIIVDDPIKNSQEASSETQRMNLWNEWQNTIMSRVQTGTKIIVIQTRWHEDDLIGRLKEKPYTTYYNLEALNESEDDPLGRKIGEALCPEMGKDEAWLENYKEGLTSGQIDEGGESGLRAWEALFQGHPSNKEGNILKREWWQFYEGTDMRYETVIMSVDPAFKDTNDYVAIGIWGKLGANIYLIDLVREHLNFEATMQVMMQKKALYQPTTILVEDKANGSAIIETLRKKIMGVVGVNPRDSKEERVNAVSFVIESGNVYLPKDRSFTPMFIEECAQFPNGKHDDMVDQMTQALARLIWVNGKRPRLMRRRTLIEDMLHKSGKSATGKGDKRVVI